VLIVQYGINSLSTYKGHQIKTSQNITPCSGVIQILIIPQGFEKSLAFNGTHRFITILQQLTFQFYFDWTESNSCTFILQIFLTVYPVKCRVTVEAPNLNSEDVIMCCLARANRNLKGAAILEYRSMTNWKYPGKTEETQRKVRCMTVRSPRTSLSWIRSGTQQCEFSIILSFTCASLKWPFQSLFSKEYVLCTSYLTHACYKSFSFSHLS
jgi:hypothetical protein